MTELEVLRCALRTFHAGVLDLDVILIEGRRLRCRRRVRLVVVVAVALLVTACAGTAVARAGADGTAVASTRGPMAAGRLVPP